MTKPIDDNFDYKSEVNKCKTIDDVMGKDGLIQRLVKDVLENILENILEGEIEEHLGRNKYERTETIEPSKKNYRNGYSSKNLRSSFGDVDLDAMYFKVRSNGKIVNKAVYICLGYNMQGYKEILGSWVDEAEGAKFCLKICTDLKNRGVKEILIACMDGLKGLPEAIKTVFPSVNIQTCIVHQIRNSIKYIASKDKKGIYKRFKMCV